MNDHESNSSSTLSFDSANDEIDDDALPSVVRPKARFDRAKLAQRAASYAHALLPPPFKWARFVSWDTLRRDLIAGVTVLAMMIPQAVAYAQLAGLSARFGFYSAGVPAIVYALLGTSHVASVGPVALSSLLSGVAVAALKLDTTADFEAASVALACLIGILQLGAGLLRLGVIVRFLSNPVLAGFTTAAGISIAVTQLKHLFGVEILDQPTVFHTIYAVGSALHTSNVPAVIVSVACVTFLLYVRWAKRRFGTLKLLKLLPEQLFVMIAGTLVSYLADLHARYATDVVGALPQAFPLPTVPDVRFMAPLFVDAMLLSLIGFTESISVSSLFANKAIYKAACPHDASQELVALGAAKVVGAFFSCFAVTGGLSRSAVAAAAGAATPMAGFVAAILAILSGFLSEFIAPLPQAVLASNIVVACIALLKLDQLKRLWLVDKKDFLLMLATIGATVGAGITLGLLISVAASLVLVVLQASTAHHARLGLVPGTTHTFRNVRRFRNVREVPHVAVVRYDARLFFANALHFRDTVMGELERTVDAAAVVADFSAINSMDSTAMDMLQELIQELESQRPPVRFIMATVKGPLRDRFDQAQFPSTDARHFAGTIRSALRRLGNEARGVDDLERDVDVVGVARRELLNRFFAETAVAAQHVSSRFDIMMSSQLHATTPEATLARAFKFMLDKRVSALAVVDSQTHALVGSLSLTLVDADLFFATAKGTVGEFLTAKSSMPHAAQRPDVISVTPSDTFGAVLRLLVDYAVHRVWVVDPVRRSPVGIVSVSDVICFVVTEGEAKAELVIFDNE